MNNPTLKRMVGDVFQYGIDPNTGEPCYYRVKEVLENGCISSTRCHIDGKPYIQLVTKNDQGTRDITIL